MITKDDIHIINVDYELIDISNKNGFNRISTYNPTVEFMLKGGLKCEIIFDYDVPLESVKQEVVNYINERFKQ